MANERLTGNVRVVRSDYVTPFTDTNLSWGAAGVWSYLSALPDVKNVTLEQIQQASPNDNPEDVAGYYYELVEAGYIQE